MQGRAGAARADREGASPLNGYYFKILSSPGGFALVAWPSEYNVTGVMTFIVNQQGKVYEKDLGPNTAQIARQMTTFNPDKTWAKAAVGEP